MKVSGNDDASSRGDLQHTQKGAPKRHQSPVYTAPKTQALDSDWLHLFSGTL